MLHCKICGKFLSPTGAVTCTSCSTKYHRSCMGISEKGQVGKEWICIDCRKISNTRGLANSSQEIVNVGPSGFYDAEEQGGTSGTREFRQEMAEWMVEMRQFREEMVKFRESLAGIETRMNGIEQRLETLEQSRVETKSGKVSALEETVAELKAELNERDREALLADLEIGQLPEERGENTIQQVCVLATRLGVQMEARDVVFAERVGGGGVRETSDSIARPRRLVVRLTRRALRDELLRAARVRRSLVSDTGARIYINERLTRANRWLFLRVREECRKLSWQYYWTKRGRIFARQADGKPVHYIRNDSDFVRVYGDTDK